MAKRETVIANNLATLERELKSAPNETAKKAINAKIKRLNNELKGMPMSAKALATSLLRARKTIKGLAKREFNDLIRRLSKKPEYAFLKGYTRQEVLDDIDRKAKPVGWRFKGRGNYAKPNAAQIKAGKANGTVYYEVRPNRSDVSQAVQLKTGGNIDSNDDSKALFDAVEEYTQSNFNESFDKDSVFPYGTKAKGEESKFTRIKFTTKSGKKKDIELKDIFSSKMAKGGGVDAEMWNVMVRKTKNSSWEYVNKTPMTLTAADELRKDYEKSGIKYHDLDTHVDIGFAEGGDIKSKLARYDKMSDAGVIEWAEDNDMSTFVERKDGKLTNRKEVLTRILELDVPNTDAQGNFIMAKGGPVQSEYVEIFATVSKKTDTWKERKEKLMELSIDDDNYAIRKDYPTIFNVNTRIKSTDIEKAKKLSDDFYHVPAEPYAKGGNIVAITKITSVQKEVDAGRVTYRGGAGGTRIKVKSKEYLISNDDFNKLGGIKKMNFKAPFRKSYKTGGEVGVGSYVSYHKRGELREGFIVDEIDENNYEIHSSKPFAQSLIRKDKVVGHVVQKRKLKLFGAGGTVGAERALPFIPDILAGDRNVELDNGDVYKAVKRLRTPALKKGMVVLTYYDAGNAGSNLDRIDGFTGDEEKYGEGGVKFDTAKELYKHYGVKNLGDLEKLHDKNEYGYHSYLFITDLSRNESGPWYYPSEGRWARGSGAEKLSFILMEKIKSGESKSNTTPLNLEFLTEEIFAVYDKYADDDRQKIEKGNAGKGIKFDSFYFRDADSPFRVELDSLLEKKASNHPDLMWNLDKSTLEIWKEELHPGVPNRVPLLIDEDIIWDKDVKDRLDDVDYTFDNQIGEKHGMAYFQIEMNGTAYILAEDEDERIWYRAPQSSQAEGDFYGAITEMIALIKKGMGWIDPEYVYQTFSQIASDVDYEWDEETATKVLSRLYAADLLYRADEDDEDEKGAVAPSITSAVQRAGFGKKSTSPEPEDDFISDIETTWSETSVVKNDVKTLLIKAYEIGGEDLQWDLVNAILDGVCEATDYIIDKDGEHAVNGQKDIKSRLERAVACIDKKV